MPISIHHVQFLHVGKRFPVTGIGPRAHDNPQITGRIGIAPGSQGTHRIVGKGCDMNASDIFPSQRFIQEYNDIPPLNTCCRKPFCPGNQLAGGNACLFYRKRKCEGEIMDFVSVNIVFREKGINTAGNKIKKRNPCSPHMLSRNSEFAGSRNRDISLPVQFDRKHPEICSPEVKGQKLTFFISLRFVDERRDHLKGTVVTRKTFPHFNVEILDHHSDIMC